MKSIKSITYIFYYYLYNNRNVRNKIKFLTNLSSNFYQIEWDYLGLGENEVTVRNGRINQSTKFNNVQME